MKTLPRPTIRPRHFAQLALPRSNSGSSPQVRRVTVSNEAIWALCPGFLLSGDQDDLHLEKHEIGPAMIGTTLLVLGSSGRDCWVAGLSGEYVAEGPIPVAYWSHTRQEWSCTSIGRPGERYYPICESTRESGAAIGVRVSSAEGGIAAAFLRSGGSDDHWKEWLRLPDVQPVAIDLGDEGSGWIVVHGHRRPGSGTHTVRYEGRIASFGDRVSKVIRITNWEAAEAMEVDFEIYDIKTMDGGAVFCGQDLGLYRLNSQFEVECLSWDDGGESLNRLSWSHGVLCVVGDNSTVMLKEGQAGSLSVVKIPIAGISFNFGARLRDGKMLLAGASGIYSLECLD